MNPSQTSNQHILESIQKKVDALNLNQNWLAVLSPWLRTELTYTSNNLEGNTLSLIETRIVIEDNQGVAGKSLREIFEAQNHAKSWDYMMQNLVPKSSQETQESDLLTIHSLILKNIDDLNAGKYRNSPVRISGSYTIFPNPLKVPDLIAEVFDWLKNSKINNLKEILDTAIQLHLKIVKIHPFTDGNGRTTRLMMNTIMLQNNLPPINILPENRNRYLEALENSTTENFEQFQEFIYQSFNQNLDSYLETFSN